MCDYSLELKQSRPAVVGERLTSISFIGSATHGFCGADSCETAVCLKEGTELAFDDHVKHTVYHANGWEEGLTTSKEARFRRVNLEEKYRHHDALEFADGAIVRLHDLAVGQTATVLQLPAEPVQVDAKKEGTELELTT